MGISSVVDFSAIHETEDMNEVVEREGEGGPEGCKCAEGDDIERSK